MLIKQIEAPTQEKVNRRNRMDMHMYVYTYTGIRYSIKSHFNSGETFYDD